MVKRTLIAMGLSLAVLLAFQLYLEKTQKHIVKEEQTVEEVKPPETGALKKETKRETKKDLVDKNAFIPAKGATKRSVRVESPIYNAVVNTAGGGFESFKLKKYRDRPEEKSSFVDVVGSGSFEPLPYAVHTGGADPPLPDSLVFSADAESLKVPAGEKKTLTLGWRSSEGFEILRTYTFHADSYLVDIKTVYRNRSLYNVQLTPGLEMSQVYQGALAGDRYSFKGLDAMIGEDIKRFTLKKVFKGKGPKTFVNWATLDSKYFAMGCIPAMPVKVVSTAPLGEEGIRIVIAQDNMELKPGDSLTFSIKAFLGPKESKVLKEVGSNFQGVLDYGFFGFIAKPLVTVLQYMNSVSGNYGIDIILLTILIKILFHPLTKKSTQSMKKMQEIQPQIKKLQAQYKEDKQKLNEEVMSLYKTYNVNPLSGCMPMILQIPVFFALYKALLVAIELRQAPFMLWINDLSAPDLLFNFSAVGYTIPFRLLPLLMGISMYLQQKLNPSSGGMDPTQQKMMNFLPLIFTVMFWGFPSGLVLYWLVNNIISIGQQYSLVRQTKPQEA